MTLLAGNLIANAPPPKRMPNVPTRRSGGVTIKDILIAAALGFAAFIIITLVFGWS